MVFLVVIFFLKTGLLNNKNQENENTLYNSSYANSGEILQDLINKDTDEDGILDWEESLWGTDPNKKDTNDDGVPDNIEIAKLKSEIIENEENTEEIKNLTQTDKFSRELFSLVTTLNQNGTMDQATIEKLSSALTEQIENAPVRKIYLISDINIENNNDKSAIQKYIVDLNNLYKKYQIKGNVVDVLQEFINSGDEPNVNILSKLDPIIEQADNFMKGVITIEVPSELSTQHLNIINALERLLENLTDIQLFDSDPIVAMGAISKYNINVDSLNETMNQLSGIINKKLNN